MRDYGKVAPTFWTGSTGRALRRRGSEAVIVSLYLMTSPHSNMLGLYYQPILYLAHETGLGIEGASKGLRDCIEEGFCRFDDTSEMVWVIEMAAYQIADELKTTDKRCAGIQKDYDALPENPFLGPFFDRYAKAFNLTNRRSGPPGNGGLPKAPPQAPSEPHRSQEQEQEQEQEITARSGSPFDLALQPSSMPPAKPPPVATLPLVGGAEFPVTQAMVDEWAAAFPAVAILPQLRRMRVWCDAHPAKRKTVRGVRRFVVGWLAKEQDRGGDRRGTGRDSHDSDDDPMMGAR